MAADSRDVAVAYGLLGPALEGVVMGVFSVVAKSGLGTLASLDLVSAVGLIPSPMVVLGCTFSGVGAGVFTPSAASWRTSSSVTSFSVP